MIKVKAFSSIVAIVLSLLTGTVFAQQPATVGDVLDKGGKKLTKEELSALLTGAVVSGTQAGTGAIYRNTLNPDGSVSGSAVRSDGQSVGVFGKWTVNDQGQQCWDLSTGPGSKFGTCAFYFLLDNVYYTSTSGDERTAALLVRDIKKR